MKQRFLIAVAVLLMLATTSSSQTSELMNEPETVVVSVDSTNLRFTPSSITIDEGDTVRFFWGGQALPHNAVEVDDTFNSGEPESDVDYSFTFEFGTAGEYDFFCEPHRSVGMEGVVLVNPVEIMDEPEPQIENDEENNSPSLSVLASIAVISLAGVLKISKKRS